MSHTICIIFSEFYSMHCILCIIFFELYYMHCNLCIVYYGLYSMHVIICIVFFALYEVNCNMFCIIYCLFYVPDIHHFLSYYGNWIQRIVFYAMHFIHGINESICEESWTIAKTWGNWDGSAELQLGSGQWAIHILIKLLCSIKPDLQFVTNLPQAKTWGCQNAHKSVW